MLKRAILLGLCLLLIPFPAAAVAQPGCVRGAADVAAARLIHPDAEVVSVVGGRAVAMAPLIAPGTPFTLLRAGDGPWCDAQAGFNALAPERAADAADAFVRTAATPWFGSDVTVRSARAVAPGVFQLQTHADRNGVVAAWTVLTDEGGIVRATFTATGFGIMPFTPAIDGMTALPGLERTWVRSADGSLAATEPIVPQPRAATLPPPGFESFGAVGVASDGFTIRVQRTNLNPAAATLTEDTGVRHVDIPRFVRRVALENYEEFLDMGFEGNLWPDGQGIVWIDDHLSLVCLACVEIRPQFQIHMISEMIAVARYVLGYNWTDDDLAFSSILGHEMVHNFQHGTQNFNVSGGVHGGFTEGVARMSEAIHTYSHTSHVARNIMFDRTSNGCNGYLNLGSDRQSGPTTGRIYDACLFWLHWYAKHGPSALWAMIEGVGANKTAGPFEEFRLGIEGATGAPVLGDLATFAGAAITGRGYSFGPGVGGGPVLDWGSLMFLWEPSPLASGEQREASLWEGAMLGAQITTGGTVTMAHDGSAHLFVVRDDGSSTTVTEVASGGSVAAPTAGESVYLVAIDDTTNGSEVTIAAP